MNRRTFVQNTGMAVLASGISAQYYGRILGANDRIRLGLVGCGSRSQDLVDMTEIASKQSPVEIVAVCDLWNKARERRAAQVKQQLKHDPQQYQYLEEMLLRKDIDGV